MESTQRTFPLQIPILGVQADRSSVLIEPQGLYDSENFIFRNSGFRVRPGYDWWGYSTFSPPTQQDFTQRPLGFLQYNPTTDPRRIVMGTDIQLWWWDKANTKWVAVSTNSNPFAGTKYSQVVMRIFQKSGTDYVLAVNGLDHPKKWDGDTGHSWADVAGTPRHAKTMAVALDHVLLAGFTDGPQELEYCSNGDFDTGWGSFSKRFGETPGEIVSLMELGAHNIAIYKTDAIHLASPYSPEYPFSFQPKYLGISGPVSPNSVVALPDGSHAYLGDDASVYRFDGVSLMSLGRHIQQHIGQTWSYKERAQAWGFYNASTRELWFFFYTDLTESISHGVCISLPSASLYPVRFATIRPSAGGHFITQTGISIGQLVMPLGQISMTLGEMASDMVVVILGDSMTGGAHGRTFYESGYEDDGAAIPAYFEYGLNAIGLGTEWKTVLTADHLFEKTPASQNITFKIGISDRGEMRSLDSGQTIDLSEDDTLVTGHRTTTRLASFRYEVNAAYPVKYLGANVAVAMRGQR